LNPKVAKDLGGFEFQNLSFMVSVSPHYYLAPQTPKFLNVFLKIVNVIFEKLENFIVKYVSFP
jgi:hypothetical protein